MAASWRVIACLNVYTFKYNTSYLIRCLFLYEAAKLLGLKKTDLIVNTPELLRNSLSFTITHSFMQDEGVLYCDLPLEDNIFKKLF